VSVRELQGGNTVIPFNSDSPLRVLGWSDSGNDLFVARGERKPPSPPQRVELLRVPLLSGAEQTILTPDATYFHSMTLSRDQKFVALASRDKGSDNLYVVSTNGGGSRQVTSNTDATVYYSGLSWSPDGKKLYYSKQRGWTVIWMIENL
jgi:Tol biopolymer transport system component